jgi:hypothetical protein
MPDRKRISTESVHAETRPEYAKTKSMEAEAFNQDAERKRIWEPTSCRRKHQTQKEISEVNGRVLYSKSACGLAVYN